MTESKIVENDYFTKKESEVFLCIRNLKQNRNMHKNHFLIATIIGLLLFSCNKQGPAGPTGATGATGPSGSSKVQTFIFRNVSFSAVYCSGCSPILYKSDISVSAITQGIVDSGTVQIAVATPGSNVWEELPLNIGGNIYSYYYITGDASIISPATGGQDVKITIVSQ